MSNVAKLKKQAAELELKKQFDKALAVYVKLLDCYDQYETSSMSRCINRVGDSTLRQGNVADAVDYYEQAVDRYAESGFFNNAIALCNKILRHSPGRAIVYYKLGKISAQKGFKSDAKINFLEYADRMQKAGKVDEAFRALKEFADLCPDQDDIRLMLAEQLHEAAQRRGDRAAADAVREKFEHEGRTAEARATVDRMKAMDPGGRAEGRRGAGPKQKPGGAASSSTSRFDEKPRRGAPREEWRCAKRCRTSPRRQKARALTFPRLLLPAARRATTFRSSISNEAPVAPRPRSHPSRSKSRYSSGRGGIELAEVEMMNLEARGLSASIDTSFGGDSLLGLETTRMSPDVEAEIVPSGSILDTSRRFARRSEITHDRVGEFGGIAPLEEMPDIGETARRDGAQRHRGRVAEPPSTISRFPASCRRSDRPKCAPRRRCRRWAMLELIMPDATTAVGTARRRGALEEFESPIARR